MDNCYHHHCFSTCCNFGCNYCGYSTTVHSTETTSSSACGVKWLCFCVLNVVIQCYCTRAHFYQSWHSFLYFWHVCSQFFEHCTLFQMGYEGTACDRTCAMLHCVCVWRHHYLIGYALVCIYINMWATGIHSGWIIVCCIQCNVY